jgi:hypothetical protein
VKEPSPQPAGAAVKSWRNVRRCGAWTPKECTKQHLGQLNLWTRRAV